MRVFKVPNSFKNYTFSKIIDMIIDINFDSNIYINDDTLNIINDINNNDNKLLIYYIIYRIISDNDLNVSDIITPKNGLSFRDLKSKESLGIYHAHLNDYMVLIWYINKYDDGYELNIEYIKHPNDMYKNILKKIYNLNNSFHLYEYDYMKNLYINSYLNENKYILSFWNFLKIYK